MGSIVIETPPPIFYVSCLPIQLALHETAFRCSPFVMAAMLPPMNN